MFRIVLSDIVHVELISPPACLSQSGCHLLLTTLLIPFLGKTHIQAQRVGHRGVVDTTRELVSRGGVRGLFTGLSAVVVGAGMFSSTFPLPFTPFLFSRPQIPTPTNDEKHEFGFLTLSISSFHVQTTLSLEPRAKISPCTCTLLRCMGGMQTTAHWTWPQR